MVKALHNLIMNDIDTEIDYDHTGFLFTFINITNNKTIETIRAMTYDSMIIKVNAFAKRVLK